MQFSKITLSLLLALPTAFASITLGDKEALNKDEVTVGCLDTYSREVKECSEKEISSGSCSSDCKAALDTLGKDVMLACRQAYAGPDTLLRKILDGGLTVTLCKTTTDNKDDEEEKKETETPEATEEPEPEKTEEPKPEETEKPDDTSNTTELVIDNSPTTVTTTPEETSSVVTETVTSDVEEPTGSTNTNTTGSSTDTDPAGTTETGNPDDTILGDDNAAGRVGAGMGIVIGATIVGFVSML